MISPPLRDLQRYPCTTAIGLAAILVTLLWWTGTNINVLLVGGRPVERSLWTLFTSTLAHANIIHLAFNLLWWWYFAARIEAAWGWARLLAATLLLAFISSAAEVALSESGVGLSGVVYGLFALAWVMQRHDPRFAGVVTRNTTTAFVVWFFACIVLTVAGLWNVGNVAHGAGAIAGALLGASVVAQPPKRTPWVAAIVLLAGLSLAGATVARPWVNFARFSHQEANRGFAALKRGDYATAVTLLEQAVAKDPKDAISHANLGLAYQHLDRHDDALNLYRQAVSLRPDLRTNLAPAIAFILARKAWDASQKDDLEIGESFADQATTWDPANPHAWRTLASIRIKRNSFEPGRAALERARAASSENELPRDDYLYDLAAIDMRTKQYAQAAERYREILARQPDRADVWFYLGECLQQLGDDAEALDAYTRAMQSAEFADRAKTAAESLKLAK